MKSVFAISRSIRTYHRSPHVGAAARFYGRLVQPDSLIFDIGAHVGDRTRAFLRLGCRVVAVEPNPQLALLLKIIYFRNRAVIIEQAAVGDRAGSLTFRINSANPAVSTASSGFITAAKAGGVGWEGQRWDKEIEVQATTLDHLIARHGVPAFVKIDVEGFEDRVLAGLSTALPALSLEFTTLRKEVAVHALAILTRLGNYRFNACLGESWSEVFGSLQSREKIAVWLEGLPCEANSGDIYCFRM